MTFTVRKQGKDATEEFDPIHPPDTLDKYLDKSKHLGDVDMQTVEKEEKETSPEEEERLRRIQEKPLLEQCYNLMDFEAVARRVMKKTAWGYYSSAADDEIVSLYRFHNLDLLLTRPTDVAGKPCRFPPNMVPAANLGRRGEGRLLHYDARHKG